MDINTTKDLIIKVLKKGITPSDFNPAFVRMNKNLGNDYFYDLDKSALNVLIDHLREEQDVINTFDGKMFNTGMGACHINLGILAKWLVIESRNKSVENVLIRFSEYLKLAYTPGVAILAISGIELKNEISISDTLKLVPFESLPASPPKESLYPSFLKPSNLFDHQILPPHWSYLPPKSALVKKINIYPKSYVDRDDENGLYKTDHLDLYESCEFFTLFSNATPVPVGSWIELDDDVPCKHMLGRGWSYPSPDVLSSKDICFSIQDWDNLKPIYNNFVSMKQKDRDLLRVPIQRINQARRRNNNADKAIDLGVAFEALFLNDREHKDQISLMFRLRAALLLGETIEEREELMRFFSTFYSCRSQAAHTGKLDKEKKIPHKGRVSVTSILDRADNLCVQSINIIINNDGFPDWNKLILKVG